MTTAELRCEDPLKLTQRTFKRFAAHITGELGIKMPISKIEMVQSRLLRRIRQLGLTSFDDYCDYYFDSDSGSQERQHLVNAITTNKTDFFREPQHFADLVHDVLPSVCPPTNRVQRMTIWSAGCSSGEEPYTLAIVLGE
jgi:chemotaxis protein methyltransferase CheR